MFRPELAVDAPYDELDDGIREIVRVLRAEGVATFESCEGGEGHCFPEPTVKFEGPTEEGYRAYAAARMHGLPVARLQRAWTSRDGELVGPWWELVFVPPRAG